MKKLLVACFLAVGLAFVSPTSVSVPQEMSLVVSAAETEAPATQTPVQAPSGWQQDANGRYYLQDGAKLTGLQELAEGRYYFDASGYLAVSKWITDNGKYYYADPAGRIEFGTIKVGKKLYHVTPDGRMNFYGKSSYDNAVYYAKANGVLKTGFQKIGGKKYYFDETTGKRASGVTKIGDYTYCFRKNGAMRTGKVKQSKGTKIYYYDNNGRRVSGWYTLKGKKYYFDPKKDDTRVQNCWKKIKKKYYYFNASGVMQTGFFTVDGKRCYTNANGVLKKGWQTINGRKYYIDPNTYVIQTGWVKYNNKKYYLNPTKTSSTYGAATTGFVNIPTKNGKKKFWYYFNSDGSMYTGWLTQNNNRYYFNPKNGRMFTGKHKIDGKEYTFGPNGALVAAVAQGAWRIEVNRRSCFVVIYRGDTPVKAFVCSTAADGVSTPTGTFTIRDHLRWHELKGPTWGQYCSHITSDILFHSVPNTRYNDNHSLEYWEYNRLGSPASAGCIRLTVRDAKYIYENCPVGTKVIISDSVARPSGISIATAPGAPNWQGNYDPTDPYA